MTNNYVPNYLTFFFSAQDKIVLAKKLYENLSIWSRSVKSTRSVKSDAFHIKKINKSLY